RRRRPRRPPPFPYPTLFRSDEVPPTPGRPAVLFVRQTKREPAPALSGWQPLGQAQRRGTTWHVLLRPADASATGGDAALRRSERSEEHTSELQSRENLVCRL